MDQTTLVSPDLATGEEVLSALDSAGIKANVALLMITSDYEDWRLVFSAPSLDQSSSKSAYLKVVTALQGRFLYTLPQMLVLPQKDPFVREMRRLFAKAKDVRGMRLGGQTIGNRSIESAYVYRVR
jgi:hypothetical protein